MSDVSDGRFMYGGKGIFPAASKTAPNFIILGPLAADVVVVHVKRTMPAWLSLDSTVAVSSSWARETTCEGREGVETTEQAEGLCE